MGFIITSNLSKLNLVENLYKKGSISFLEAVTLCLESEPINNVPFSPWNPTIVPYYYTTAGTTQVDGTEINQRKDVTQKTNVDISSTY